MGKSMGLLPLLCTSGLVLFFMVWQGLLVPVKGNLNAEVYNDFFFKQLESKLCRFKPGP